MGVGTEGVSFFATLVEIVNGNRRRKFASIFASNSFQKQFPVNPFIGQFVIFTQFSNVIRNLANVGVGNQSLLAVQDGNLPPSRGGAVDGFSLPEHFDSGVASSLFDNPLLMLLHGGEDVDDKHSVGRRGVQFRCVENDDSDIPVRQNPHASGTVNHTAEAPVVCGNDNNVLALNCGEKPVTCRSLKPRNIRTDGRVLEPAPPFKVIPESPNVLLKLKPRLASRLLCGCGDFLNRSRRPSVTENVIHWNSPDSLDNIILAGQ